MPRPRVRVAQISGIREHLHRTVWLYSGLRPLAVSVLTEEGCALGRLIEKTTYVSASPATKLGRDQPTHCMMAI